MQRGWVVDAFLKVPQCAWYVSISFTDADVKLQEISIDIHLLSGRVISRRLGFLHVEQRPH